jgi:O-antigen/teichoic acid export membrane protein
MAAGFISFPILTRIFSVSDYGTLGLISTTLFIALAVGKFGLPNSIVRFYAEFKAHKQLDRFYSTIFWGSLLLTALIAVIFVLATQLVLKHYWRKDIVALLALVAILIVINAMSDILTSFMRAEQRTKLYNGITIMRRYASLGSGIFFIFYFFKGLFGFYIGQVFSGAVILFLIFYYFQSKM